MGKTLEKHTEIERSIIKKFRKTIWNNFIGAVKEYELIAPGDKIAVCISGGKDSMLLAKCVQQLQRHSEIPFEAEYIVMDPGYNAVNRALIEDIKKVNPNVDDNIFRSIHNVNMATIPGWRDRDSGTLHSFTENY